MRTLATSQSALMKSGTIASIVLAKLDIYTNYETKQINDSYFWSYPMSVHYSEDLAGGGDQYFDGIITSITPPSLTIPFPPARDGFTSRSALVLTVANVYEVQQGMWLWRRLREYSNIIGSHLTLAELLIPPSRYQVDGSTAWWDMRDLPGDEHTIIFRGELLQAERCTLESIDLRFASVEPRVPRVELLDSDNNDPRDFGSYLPIPYGQAKHVPCKNMVVGWTTTLAEYLPLGETGTYQVTDATGFPTSMTFDIMIGSEIIECSDSNHDTHTITINARAQDDTADAAHIAGDQIMEIVDEIVFGISGYWITDLKAFYLTNPFNGELTRYTGAGVYRKGDQRSRTFGFPGGSKFSTITIDREDFVDWLLEARTSARVRIQPEFDGGTGTFDTDTASPYSASEQSASSSIDPGVWTGISPSLTTAVWTATAGEARTQLQGSFSGGTYGTDTIVRFRIYLEATLSGWAGGPASLRMKGFNLLGCHLNALTLIADGDGTFSAATPYAQPTGKTLEDLDSEADAFILQPNGVPREVWTIDAWRVEAETLSGGDVDRIVDTEIEAASTGFGLQAYADIDGPFVPFEFPDNDYDFEEGGSGTWEVDNATQERSTDEYDGTYSQKMTVSSGTGVMQYNSVGSGGLDLQSYSDFYRVALKGVNVENIVSLRMWLANTGSGSTIPSDRLELTIPPGVLVEDTWLEFFQFGARYGSPFTDLSDCDTIGMEMEVSGGSASVYFDYLGITTSSNSYYDDAPGTLIEAGPDIIQHFIAEYCGLGYDVIDATSFATAKANLGSNIYAGNFSGLGVGFDEIIGSASFEMRSSMIRAEGTLGTVYRMVNASGAGAYPSVDRSLTEWTDISSRLPPIEQIGTRFRAFWSWDAFLGDGEDAFTEVSRCDPDVSDCDLGAAIMSGFEKKIGRRDDVVLFLLLVNDETTAEDTLEFYARYGINPDHEIMTLESPTWDCFDLEPGDIIDILAFWDIDYDSEQKMMILGNYRTPGDPTGRLELRTVI
jgi:hypothetical protein